MKTEVISIRVKADVRRALLKRGVNIPKHVKECLERLADEEGSKEAMIRMKEIVEKKVKPSRKGFAVSSVREDRNENH